MGEENWIVSWVGGREGWGREKVRSANLIFYKVEALAPGDERRGFGPRPSLRDSKQRMSEMRELLGNPSVDFANNVNFTHPCLGQRPA
jgi:hypothetical protein